MSFRRSILFRRACLVGLCIAASAFVFCVPSAVADPGCTQNATVSDLGDDGGANQLRAQLVAVCDGGVVKIIPGTVVLHAGVLSLTRDVTIDGLGPAANPTVIDGGHLSRVLDVVGVHVGISDLTVTGGTADNGGALRNTAGTVELTRVTVTGNIASNAGGGIASFGTSAASASVTLNESSVVANSATFGGGGIVNVARGGNALLVLNNSVVGDNVAAGPGTPFGGGILNSTSLPPMGGIPSTVLNGTTSVTANRATYGGGIFNNGDGTAGQVTLNDAATVSGNESVLQGGGIFNFGQHGAISTLTLNDGTTIRNNQAHGRGGGVFNEGALVLNGRSIIEENTATFEGGGVDNFAQTAPASIVLHNDSTIRNNTAGTTGGGIFNLPSGQPATVTLLDNSTVTSNHPNNCTGAAC